MNIINLILGFYFPAYRGFDSKVFISFIRYAKKVKKAPESNYGYTPSYKINYDYKPPEDTEDKKY